METILAHLKTRGAAAEKHPILEYFRDTSVPAEERLTKWLFHATQFILGFRDFCNLCLRFPAEEAENCPLKKSINEHADEDGNHWKWFYEDLKVLGLNKTYEFTDILSKMWSEETEIQRLGAYTLIAVAMGTNDPMMRYVIAESIEVFGNMFFEAISHVGKEYEALTGKSCKYLGHTHFEQEQGHLAGQGDQGEIEHSLFEKAELTPEQIEQGMEITRKVEASLIARWDDMARVCGRM